MTYEDALELKNAGFPQYGEGKKTGSINSEGRGEAIYIPTLEELIEACGDRFLQLEKIYVSNEFIALGLNELNYRPIGKGSTPEQAVKNLWMVLNKKQI